MEVSAVKEKENDKKLCKKGRAAQYKSKTVYSKIAKNITVNKKIFNYMRGWAYSGYSWISGFRCLSERKKKGFEMHF